ncbi:MAG: hypothetical protein HZB46_14405 [Solirubrobacterales bacterium]|nr:hypothetical protein [Solirubrobacterales bacterium]
MSDPTVRRSVGVLAGLGIAGLVLLVLGINWIAGFKSVPPGEVCVVQEGGPFDGRGVKEVRQPSSGVQNIGIFNKQHCFPATERNYIISADPSQSDRRNVDFFATPTADAVQVRIEGQALFRLTTDPQALREFYRRFGVRTFSGRPPTTATTAGRRSWRSSSARCSTTRCARPSAATAASSSTTPAPTSRTSTPP